MDRAEQIDRAALWSRHLPAEQFRAGLDGRLRRAGERGQTYEKQKQADPPDGAMFHGGNPRRGVLACPDSSRPSLRSGYPRPNVPPLRTNRRGAAIYRGFRGMATWPQTAALTIDERRHDWKA